MHSLGKADSGGGQPLELHLEFQPQLRAFIFGKAAGHLREDHAIERDAMRIPWESLRRAGFAKYLMQPRAHPVRVGPEDGWRIVVAEQVRLFLRCKKVFAFVLTPKADTAMATVLPDNASPDSVNA